MDKFDLLQFKRFSDLPLDQFNRAGYSIYVLDKNWNYLFVNNFVTNNLGDRAKGMNGKNMWEFFPELANDSSFLSLRSRTEKGMDSNFETLSPITGQRLNITGHPLADCFIFTSSILPKKEEVLDELRRQLSHRNTTNKTNL